MKLLKKMRYIFSMLLVVSLLFSVPPVVHTPEVHGFIPMAGPGVVGKLLMPHIFKPQWKISYRYGVECQPADRQNGEALKEAISSSLRTWLQPIKELKPQGVIVDKFVYELQPDFDPNQFDRIDRNQPGAVEKIREILREEWREIDLRVTFQCEQGRSYAAIGLLFPPAVVMRRGTETTPEMLFVLVHELGHTFGLADTYARPGIMRNRGGLRFTTGKQPVSVMAKSRHVHVDNLPPPAISEDDKRGIIWLYKYFHEQQEAGNCFFADYIYLEEGGMCEPKHPLIFETKHNHTKYALQILEDDPTLDVNAQDVNGMTALHYAVMYEKVEVVKALLAHEKIKPFLKNKYGETPLDIAQETNHAAIIAMFPPKPLDVAPGTNLTTTWGAMKQR